jgi:ribosome biogenesis protein NSA2
VQPQGEHIELHRKRHGRRLDHEERTYGSFSEYLFLVALGCFFGGCGNEARRHVLFRRKKAARAVHERPAFAKKVHGLKAKLYNKKRFQEKAIMKKTYAVSQR